MPWKNVSVKSMVMSYLINLGRNPYHRWGSTWGSQNVFKRSMVCRCSIQRTNSRTTWSYNLWRADCFLQKNRRLTSCTWGQVLSQADQIIPWHNRRRRASLPLPRTEIQRIRAINRNTQSEKNSFWRRRQVLSNTWRSKLHSHFYWWSRQSTDHSPLHPSWTFAWGMDQYASSI